MILTSVRVRNFRNILDTETEIGPDVTCLVGKNESGKTAFLHALERLNPQRTGAEFDAHRNYPAWIYKKHRKQGDLDEFTPISATFELTDSDLSDIVKRFGKKVVKGGEIVASRNYGNQLTFEYDEDEKAAVAHVMSQTSLPQPLVPLKTADSFGEVVSGLTDWISNEERGEKDIERVNAALELIKSLGARSFSQQLLDAIARELPGFVYFDRRHPCFSSIRI